MEEDKTIMMFQKKIDQAFEKLHEESQNADIYYEHSSLEEKQEAEKLELEKGDKAAMIIAALIVIVPVALLVLLILGGAAFLFLI